MQVWPSLWSQWVFSLPQETGSAGLSDSAQAGGGQPAPEIKHPCDVGNSLGVDPAFPRAGQDAWFFSSQFWGKCEVSLNGSYNDLSTAKDSSFQSFLSLQTRPLAGDSSDGKDKAAL